MLEGNEIEKSYDGGNGKLILDVTDKGGLTIVNSYSKDLGFAKVKNDTAFDTNIFKVAEAIAAKTQTKWDDEAIAALKKILGIE